MKKTVKVAAIGLGLVAVFAVGNLTSNASLDWKSNAINHAYNALLDARNEVQDEILDNAATDINNTIQEGVTDAVDANADELQRLMDEYYRLKLAGLTESDEFKSLEIQIEGIMNTVYGSFQTEVDKAFEEAGL